MIDLSIFLSALDGIKEWFDSLKPPKHLGEERHQEAITALYTALNETKIYIGSLSSPIYRGNDGSSSLEFRRSKKTEAKLSRLWTEASLKLRLIDHHLADRCLLKSDYWTNPDEWSEEDIKKACIQIDSVFNDARKLL